MLLSDRRRLVGTQLRIGHLPPRPTYQGARHKSLFRGGETRSYRLCLRSNRLRGNAVSSSLQQDPGARQRSSVKALSAGFKRGLWMALNFLAKRKRCGECLSYAHLHKQSKGSYVRSPMSVPEASFFTRHLNNQDVHRHGSI